MLPKLAALQSAVRGLGKDTKGNSYEYVSGSKVLDAVRPRMDELGLLLVQEVEDIRNERVDYSTRNGAKSEMFTSVSMVFTWIDTESGEKLPVRFAANGCNGWDKGLGSALTYGERYFLLKFFHIATDEDDVDARQGEEAAPVSQPAPLSLSCNRASSHLLSIAESLMFISAAKGCLTTLWARESQHFTGIFSPREWVVELERWETMILSVPSPVFSLLSRYSFIVAMSCGSSAVFLRQNYTKCSTFYQNGEKKGRKGHEKRPV